VLLSNIVRVTLEDKLLDALCLLHDKQHRSCKVQCGSESKWTMEHNMAVPGNRSVITIGMVHRHRVIEDGTFVKVAVFEPGDSPR
jgi:hypothetical protein